MSWMLHAVSLGDLEVVVGVALPAVVESFFILHVISTTNDVNLSVGSIDKLKVVRERSTSFGLGDLNGLVWNVQSQHVFRVLLQNVNVVQRSQ